MINRIIKVIMDRHSIRLFQQKEIGKDILKDIVSVAPYAPSRQNKQPLKFLVVNDINLRKFIFKNILWGSKVPAYKIYGEENNIPGAFIFVIADKKISPAGFEYEIGAAIQNMLIIATAYQLGSVWIKSFDRQKIHSFLKLDDNMFIDSLIALGYPRQISSTTIMEDNQYLPIINNNLNVHVPKRSIEEVILWYK